VNCCEGEAHPFVSYWWIAALLIHSVTDGYLLGISEGFAPSLRDSVWAFLVVHKVLEALWVSSLLALEFKKRSLVLLIAAYVFTFPFGYLFPHLLRTQAIFSAHVLSFIFEIAGSLSMGSLLACVVVDQLIPSVKNIKRDFRQIAWFLMGFAVTHAVLFLSGSEHHAH
jgi:zinc transporter ZupT